MDKIKWTGDNLRAVIKTNGFMALGKNMRSMCMSTIMSLRFLITMAL